MYLPKSADLLTIAGVVVHGVARLTDRIVALAVASAALDRVALGLPGRQSARDPRDVPEARPSEQRGGHARAIAARAHHHDRAVTRQVIEPIEERARGDVPGARDVAGGVFAGLADVDHHGRLV